MEWTNVVYGPVKSRRLGQSLGINLTPLELKVCNFNCGYCRVGVISKGKAEIGDYEGLGWTPENVRASISRGLEYHAQEVTSIDYVTIAGNGEPTMYPWFNEIVSHLVTEKSRCLQDRPTAIFANATKVNELGVKETVSKLGRRFYKLDAGDEKTFRRINIPIGVTYTEIIKNLLSSDNFELSMAVLDGEVSNYDSFFNSEFIETLRKMRFTRMFIYDIDIPKTISPKFNRKIEKGKLENLAQHFSQQLNRKLGEDIVILWGPTTREGNIPLYPQQTN